MTAALRSGALSSRDLPGPAWWLVLAATLVLQFAVGWIAAAGVLVFLLIQRVRPLDFLNAYLLVVAGGSFVNYTRGGLTFELSLLSVGILFMMLCYVLTVGTQGFTVRRAAVTVPLLLYLGLSLLNFGRGLLAGNSTRYAGLEILAVLALASCLLVANLRMDFWRLRLMAAVLWIVSLGHCVLGFVAFAKLHVRTGSIYFTPVPGVVAMLLFNMALRLPRARDRWLVMLALMPLLMHQFLSFTRGYWLAIIGSTLFSLALYGGRSAGAGGRWRRAATLMAVFTGVAVVGAAVLAAVFHISGLGALAASRISSSAGTQLTFETSSNIVRLVEYAHVLELIVAAPWLGHGLGYFFVVREPIHLQLIEQWFVHQNYLLVWLKQGLLGLGLFVGMLIAAVRTGIGGRRLREPLAAGWCAGVAAVTVYILIYSLVHFPLAEVNTTFTVALVWGGAIALTSREAWTLRWRRGRAL